MTQQTTAVQQQPKQALTIRDRLEGADFKAAVAKALPKHLTPDRFIRVACTAMTKTPKLLQCDQASFFAALLTLSQLGLEPDGRRAHLIPFGDQVQLIIDYKGLVELIMRSGMVSNLHADVVCINDIFGYDMGQIKMHKINFMEPRGAVYAVYCIARFKDGSEKCDVMTVDEVEAIRSRSKAGKAGPWVTDWNEMAKKTVFRRLSKWLPLSPEFRDAIDSDEDVPIEITTTAAFDVEPKTKPNLGPKKEEPKREEPIQTVSQPSALEPEDEKPKKSKAKAAPVEEPVQTSDDGDLGQEIPNGIAITPELAAKLVELNVPLTGEKSFETWLNKSGYITEMKADTMKACQKLMESPRTLTKIQTLHGS